MKIPEWLRLRLLAYARRTMASRPADFVIAPYDEPYLYRWHIIKTKWFSLYVHKMVHDDDDRALHDHPGDNVSVLLSGAYYEHLENRRRISRIQGDMLYRKAEEKHRLEMVFTEQTISLWVVFHKRRVWGFWPDGQFVPWHDFVDQDSPGRVRADRRV